MNKKYYLLLCITGQKQRLRSHNLIISEWVLIIINERFPQCVQQNSSDIY